MQYVLSKRFEKNFAKLPKKLKTKAIDQLALFVVDPMDARLNNHALSGKWSDYRSINITGDIRAIYTPLEEGIARFVDIGSHAQLYS